MIKPTDPDIALISRRLAPDPCLGALTLLAENYLEQQKYELAAAISRQGLQLYPDQLDLYLILGQALFALESWSEVEASMQPVVTAIKRLGLVFGTLTKLYRREGRHAEAEEAATLFRLLQGETGPPLQEDFWELEIEADTTSKMLKVRNTLIKWQQALKAQQKADSAKKVN